MQILKACFLSVFSISSLFASQKFEDVTFDSTEAVLFDCDGVLVDTEYFKFLAWQDALREKGIDFSIEEYMPLVGLSGQDILKKISQSKNLELPEDIITARNQKYHEMRQSMQVPPMPEMIQIVQIIAQAKKSLGLKLALVSSAPRAEMMMNLKQIGLEDAFDFLVSGEDDLDNYNDLEGKNKPKPYVYQEASRRLEVCPEHCVVFEDSSAGVEAAARAGMNVIAVPNRFTEGQDFSKAAVVIDSPHQLLEAIHDFLNFQFFANEEVTLIIKDF